MASKEKYGQSLSFLVQHGRVLLLFPPIAERTESTESTESCDGDFMTGLYMLSIRTPLQSCFMTR